MSGLSNVTAWGWFWLVWALTAIVVELYWVFVNTANTLSRQIWAIEMLDFAHPLDFHEWTPMHWILALSLTMFFEWLAVHFAFGWLR